MAPALTMQLDTTRWEAALRQLATRGPVAIARGLNRTGASERTAMARAVATDMGIKVSDARNAITVQKASVKSLAVRVVATGRRQPLIDFKARGPEPSRGRGAGVSYAIGKERKRISTAFITTTSVQRDGSGGSHRGVFVRVPGARRLPIKQLYGPSIAKSFATTAPAGAARRAEVLEKNVAHEIEFELSRLAAAK